MGERQGSARVEPGPSPTEVRAHYAGLATRYAQGANTACSRACGQLVHRVLAGTHRVIEVGAGSCTQLRGLSAPKRVAFDLSLEMLRAQRAPVDWTRMVGDALALPFRDAAFDGLYAVNVLEHVADPGRFMGEARRVLAPRGRVCVVTPNGDLEWLLDLLERLHLKLPEGPHRFLTFGEVEGLARHGFRTVEHRRFLVFPVGSGRLSDRVQQALGRRGLFQYAVFERRG